MGTSGGTTTRPLSFPITLRDRQMYSCKIIIDFFMPFTFKKYIQDRHLTFSDCKSPASCCTHFLYHVLRVVACLRKGSANQVKNERIYSFLFVSNAKGWSFLPRVGHLTLYFCTVSARCYSKIAPVEFWAHSEFLQS